MDADLRNLAIANQFYGNKLGSAGSIMLKAFNVPGHNITQFLGMDFLKQSSDTQDLYDEKLGKYNDLLTNLKNKYPPQVASNIEAALSNYIRTNEIKGADNAYIGFGKLSRTVMNTINDMYAMEAKAVRNGIIPDDRDEFGNLTEDVIEQLMSKDSNYAIVRQAAVAYAELGLNLPNNPGLLEQLSNIRNDEPRIDAKENEIYEKSLEYDFDFSTNPNLPSSHAAQTIEDNEEIEAIFNESMTPAMYSDTNMLDLGLESPSIPADSTLMGLVDDINSGNINIFTEPMEQLQPMEEMPTMNNAYSYPSLHTLRAGDERSIRPGVDDQWNIIDWLEKNPADLETYIGQNTYYGVPVEDLTQESK